MRLPFFKQRNGYYCGPASLDMALRFLGKHATEKKLAYEAHTRKDIGTTHHGMIEAALKENLYAYVNSRATLEEIKYFLSRKLPVIVDFTEPSSGEGHYAVITSCDSSKVVLNDPWNGKGFKLGLHNFLNRWHDTLTHSHGWIMVLSNEDFKLGKQFTPGV